MKRSIDLVAAVLGVIILHPVLIVVALLIKFDDGGTVFFKQWRLGRYKRPFLIWKFRTMSDGHITRIGRWLRASGLDELPQIMNVLRGDMSIVGPRPLTLADVQRLGWDTRFYIRRWHLKPGITGLSQLYAGRSAHHSWLFDRTYLKQQNLLLDIRIIGLSFLMNVFGKKRIRDWLYCKSSRVPDWHRWVMLFASRRERSLPQIARQSDEYTWSKPLAQSLAIFQLGESGGGTIVSQVEHSALRGIDRAYRQAIAWFVDEEHRHAQILARCVTALGGACISHNWTARLFVHGRRLLGLRLKVLVLLAAEEVGICYYTLLAMRLPLGEIRDALEELAKDEEAHLKFHSDFLRMHVHGFLGVFILKIVWRFVTFSAACVVIIDHHHSLRVMGIPVRLVWRRWMYLVNETEKQILNHRSDYQFLQDVNLVYALGLIKN